MEDYTNDELCAPYWMDKTFFENVLKKCENNESVLLTPASQKGDHFGSIMFRATISYDTTDSKGKFKLMIIKAMPEDDGIKKEMLGDTYIFETEINMYSETIPEFEAELRKIGDNTVLGARVLYYSLSPRKYIIFDDIVPMGFATTRQRMATISESRAALLKLAKWHAVSFKLAQEGDKSVTAYKKGFLNMKKFKDIPFIATGMENFINMVETIDELKMYIPKLQSIKKDLVKRCINSFNSYRQDAAKGIFVLCHGDFHLRNMMFKHSDEGEVQDVMLHDFQLCYFGPAVLDVMYAVYLLMSVDDRKYHTDELIHFYCSSFIETLEKLQFQGEKPKVADFMNEIENHRHFELFFLSTFLAMIYSTFSSETAIDSSDVMASNDIRKAMYLNLDFQEEVKFLLPKMLYQG